nr:MAG TPA: hypothetical protein [Caudoviricetes sp.]DAV98328.1 MAG TPA: hypothetical protein [Caudoviricetes sp.]
MLHFLTRQEWTGRKNSCSNPPAPTKQEKSEPISDWRRVRIFRFLRV